jgi:2,3-bisphosphoglycerate-independent phosphoglycerate mutase
MSKILCIIDGMSGPDFDTENFPALASFPIKGTIETVPDGFEAETLSCVLSLLGIKPPKNIRGWIEALGAGIDVCPDDLIFRGSWVSLDGSGICSGFCGAPREIPGLGHARYVFLSGYKCLLIIPGCASCAASIQMPLPFELLGKYANNCLCPDVPLLRDALALINAIDPNRAMIPWAPSTVQAMPDLSQFAAVCGANIVRGIAKALNMRLVTGNTMTGDTDTDLSAKLKCALELADEHPFVMLHIGGCDEAAHRMNKTEKDEFLHKVDKTVISGLLQSGHAIDVVSDHGSDPLTGRHIGGGQPIFSCPEKMKYSPRASK